MEPFGSNWRRIALYGGDSAVSRFIPGISGGGPFARRQEIRAGFA
jgi:hypothetical protein